MPTPARADAICVVICCYTEDRWDLLTASIDAARSDIRPGDQLVVVVDHNDELLRRLTRRYGDCDMTISANTGARGLSGARNSGAANADAGILVYLDDDAVLRPGSLDRLRTTMADDTLVAVGGEVQAQWSHTTPAWFPDEFGWVVGCDYRGIPASGADIRNPIGAAMAVRRDALAKIGGFDADLGRIGTLPAGCEETLMGIELRRMFPDTRIIRDTAFGVDHHVPTSRQTVRYFTSRCYHEGRSKATLTAMTGASTALSAEVAFLARTVTSGAVRYLSHLLRGRIWAGAQLVMMLAGVLVTVFGTATGSFAQRARTQPSVPAGGVPRLRHPIGVDDRVSVVIATVGRDFLPDTVRGVLALDHADLEVIVVDNRPAEGTARRLLAGFTEPNLRIIDEPVAGISSARNTGAAAATGAVIAFTDDDATPEPTWLRHVMQTFDADVTASVGVVTGRVLSTDDPSEMQSWFEEAKIFDKGETATVWSTRPRPEYAALGEIAESGPFFPYTAGEMGQGNNLAIAAETFTAVGGFDERLGIGTITRGGEDLDLLRTAALDGWAVAYSPDALIRHYHRDNMSDLRWQNYGYGVGMAASLTKLMTTRHAFSVLRRIPIGIYVLLAPASVHNKDLPEEWPVHLRLIELFGYLVGPIHFIRSHVRVQRRRRGSRGVSE